MSEENVNKINVFVCASNLVPFGLETLFYGAEGYGAAILYNSNKIIKRGLHKTATTLFLFTPS